jgi:hypothetical protein
MAWVRIHDGAMQSMKIAKLSDSAFRLWVRGLCYCQTALTDGLIPREALRDMGAKRKDVEMLSAVLVDGKGPLWEHHDIGFKVHDYLDWNDCRDKVIERQEKAKKRKEDWEERQRKEPTLRRLRDAS